jgi:tetratricopeptide (TPR) repeat protein
VYNPAGKEKNVKGFVFFGLILVLLCCTAAAHAARQGTASPLSMNFPGEPWALAVDAPGFKVSKNGMQPDGRDYLLASNPATNVELSIVLEKVQGAATADDCERNQKARLAQKVPYERTDIGTRETAGMMIFEFTIPEFSGAPVQQRNAFACIPKNDVYVDIHLSKIQFKPKEEALFDSVLASIHFVDQPGTNSGATPSDSSAKASSATLESFNEGSRYFLQQNFAAAIGPYQKALDAEKQNPTLDKTLWHVLIDNLGMAYGITGDLDRAEATFNYGVSKDPEYPLFYYNLACVAAGRNDMDKTMQFLQTAFAHKGNIIQGETMPDPSHDDSFQAFMANPRFRDFVNNLLNEK